MLDYCTTHDCYTLMGWFFSGIVFGIVILFIIATLRMDGE